jgi:hypothetical protein
MYLDHKEFLFNEEEIAQSLDIPRENLTTIIDNIIADNKFFEDVHFRTCNNKYQEKIFSKQGAFIIADYLDTRGLISDLEIKDFINLIDHKNKDNINKLINHKECQLLRYEITMIISENCTSLTKINDRHFLNKTDTINILQTNIEQLDNVFRKLIRLRRRGFTDEHFCDIHGERYFSFLGLAKFSQELSKILPESENYYREFSIIGSSVLEQRSKLLPYIPDKNLINYMKNKAFQRDTAVSEVMRYT